MAGELFARLVNRGPEWGIGRQCAGLAERLSLPPMPQTVTKRPVPEWNRPSAGDNAMIAATLLPRGSAAKGRGSRGPYRITIDHIRDLVNGWLPEWCDGVGVVVKARAVRVLAPALSVAKAAQGLQGPTARSGVLRHLPPPAHTPLPILL